MATMGENAAAIVIQRYFRGFLTRKQYAKNAKVFHRRERIVKEILSSEEVYAHNLKIIVGIFLNPLRAAIRSPKPIVSLEEIRELFSNIESIAALNSALLKELRDACLQPFQFQTIGAIFIQMIPFLKVYTQYCENYDHAIKVMTELMSINDSFRYFIEMCHQMPECQNLTLVSFLILPIQRIPRYTLLLEDLYHNTWPTHKDYENLAKALTSMREVAELLNKNLKFSNNFKEVLRIQKELGSESGNLLKPQRKFIKEGKLKEIVGMKSRIVYWYLFSDILLYAHSTNLPNLTINNLNLNMNINIIRPYRYKGEYPMESTVCMDLPDSEERKNAFRIVTSTNDVINVCTKTAKEKQDWLFHLNNVMVDAQKEKSVLEQMLGGKLPVETGKNSLFTEGNEDSVLLAEALHDLQKSSFQSGRISPSSWLSASHSQERTTIGQGVLTIPPLYHYSRIVPRQDATQISSMINAVESNEESQQRWEQQHHNKWQQQFQQRNIRKNAESKDNSLPNNRPLSPPGSTFRSPPQSPTQNTRTIRSPLNSPPLSPSTSPPPQAQKPIHNTQAQQTHPTSEPRTQLKYSQTNPQTQTGSQPRTQLKSSQTNPQTGSQPRTQLKSSQTQTQSPSVPRTQLKSSQTQTQSPSVPRTQLKSSQTTTQPKVETPEIPQSELEKQPKESSTTKVQTPTQAISKSLTRLSILGSSPDKRQDQHLDVQPQSQPLSQKSRSSPQFRPQSISNGLAKLDEVMEQNSVKSQQRSPEQSRSRISTVSNIDLTTMGELRTSPRRATFSKLKSSPQMLPSDRNSEQIRTDPPQNRSIMISDWGSLVRSISTKEGFLLKKGQLNPQWKRRFFVLEDGKLKYYKSKKPNQQRTPVGVIDLEDFKVRPHSTKDFSFEIATKTRTFVLGAENKESYNEWIDILGSLQTC